MGVPTPVVCAGKDTRKTSNITLLSNPLTPLDPYRYPECHRMRNNAQVLRRRVTPAVCKFPYCQAQPKPSPSWLSSIVITVDHPGIQPSYHPEKYYFQAPACRMLRFYSSLIMKICCQAQPSPSSSWLSSIIITVSHPASHPAGKV